MNFTTLKFIYQIVSLFYCLFCSLDAVLLHIIISAVKYFGCLVIQYFIMMFYIYSNLPSEVVHFLIINLSVLFLNVVMTYE